jgi:nucleotide-binding universal stress UspA family protein
MRSLQLAAPSPTALPSTDALFSRIVLGVDFGSASLAAARWATTHVAIRAHALLSHVVPIPDHARGCDDEDVACDASLRQMTPALTGGLGGFAATLDVASARSILRMGSPSRWLSAIANDAQASLVVLGRRADASRVRVGEPNVIERASRRTSASVLVVPEGSMHSPARVLAAVDESAFAPKVLAIARRLALIHEAPLIVLHVLSPAIGAYERVIRTAQHLLGRGRRLRSEERPVAANALPACTARWLVEVGHSHVVPGRDRTEIAMGDPAREIAATAAADEGTLIVVGMRGADNAPQGSIGSVARELLTRAPVPVLAVNGA